jgi:hypothetical protein
VGAGVPLPGTLSGIETSQQVSYLTYVNTD